MNDAINKTSNHFRNNNFENRLGEYLRKKEEMIRSLRDKY
jgi:hypothetical protein